MSGIAGVIAPDQRESILRTRWRDLLHDALLGRDGRVAGLVNPAVVRQLIDEHERGSDRNRLLWGLLFLELWLREVE